MTLRIAFTGTGWAAEVHAKAAQTIPDVQLAAVVNHRHESREAFAARFGIEHQYQHVAELIEAGGVDALVVSTPNFLHVRETCAALDAGIHVMVEKPMTMNAAEAAQVVEIARESRASLMVAHCFRYDPELIWLKEQVALGAIGRPIRTKGYGVHVGWGPAGWFTDKQLAGGGALVDMGIHAVDAASFVLGDPKPMSVYARVGTYYKESEVDDTGIIIVNWENGCASYVESGWWQPHADGPCAATHVYGTQGVGQVFPAELRFISAGDDQKPSVQAGPTIDRPMNPPQSVYNDQLSYFVQCIREARPPEPGGSIGLQIMRILDAAYESAMTDRVVKL